MDIQFKIFKKFVIISLSLIQCLSAQFISVKTVPVANGNQFLIFPSENLGMGGVSIAVNDYMLDPFINPAKGSWFKNSYLFVTPAFNSISNELGSSKTLPLGMIFTTESYFGGAIYSFQQIKSSRPDQMGFLSLKSDTRITENNYFYGMIGKKVNEFNTSIAASVFWADLTAIEGVNLLFLNSREIDQFGKMLDLKVGVFHETEQDRKVELLFLYNRLDMTYKVASNFWFTNTSYTKHLDKTNTFGLHLGYVQPFLRKHWSIGGILTGNWKSHPKIPDYDIMNIPRDPGNSWAYNFGIGLSKKSELATVGIDLIYEPIWSNTWSDALESIISRTGETIHPGEKTVDNDFRFSNVMLRMGFKTHQRPVGLQLGIQMHRFHYWLEQENFIEAIQRHQKENWTEWTISWGLDLYLTDIQLSYTGRMLLGTGIPSVLNNDFRLNDFAVAKSDFLVAPNGQLLLKEEHVLFHQIIISVPLNK